MTSVLEEAELIINGQRREDYGSCLESFERIATLWNAYLRTKFGNAQQALSAEDVAFMMIQMKIARYVNGGTRDSVTDIAGYAGCLEKLRAESGRPLL